ncbi:MAG TPA: DUF433 domain-containing protein [Candidatus Acidoferrales bacterium]|nr:DUF433 domain-containing protein [Candidatus Acidoferrales bacterium]
MAVVARKQRVADHIEVTPGVCGGKPRIAGSRIRVQDIVAWHERLGQSPESIVEQFPQLSLADIHAALTYYFDHREEIERQTAEDITFADTVKAHARRNRKPVGNGKHGRKDAAAPR